MKDERWGRDMVARSEIKSGARAGGVIAMELENSGHTHRHSGDAGID